MRLDKYLADAGLGTRSQVKKMISAGRVTVDGTPVRDPACRLDEERSAVYADGSLVRYARFEYYMLNKPQGVISAAKDETGTGQICVTGLIHDRIRKDLFPVGRLDKDTEGLLLITNDGALCHALLSPKRHVDKTYYARLDGAFSDEDAAYLMKGADIGDETLTLPCLIERISEDSCHITVHEGRYHQIKRMFSSVGREVLYLKRLSMGPLKLDQTLSPGEYRALTDEEFEALRLVTGLNPG